MDRIIEVKVGGNYLCKDNKNAGVRGEGNVTVLRIAFDESWDNYAKTITFWDARGKNPVMIMLTKNRLENIVDNSRVYLVPIPPEPLVEAGEMTFVIDGFKGNFEKDGEGNDVIVYDGTNKRQRSMSDRLVVKDAPMADDAGEPTDPTPTPPEQWQEQIDQLTGDIRGAYIARDEAQKAEQNAENSAEQAKISAENASAAKETAVDAIGKTSYIGDNGNWYSWGVDGFYDTGVKAQAGSTVYVGENPPDEADVWIDPNGEILEYATKEELSTVAAGQKENSMVVDFLAHRLDQWSPERPIYNKDVTMVDDGGTKEIEKIDVITYVDDGVNEGYLLERCTLKDTKARELLEGKVGKVDGKGLSTNDFTNAFKAMLENVDDENTASPVSTNLITSAALYGILSKMIPQIDAELNEKSENPVQNKVVTEVISSLGGELHTLGDNALTKDELTLENKDDENLTIETTNITPMWLPTEQYPEGAPFKILFKDTKAREQIANIPMQKIFEVTTTEAIDQINITNEMLDNVKLDRVFIYINTISDLSASASWSTYINNGNNSRYCLYYLNSIKTTGRHFIATAERMDNGMWYTQSFNTLNPSFYTNNYISGYRMAEVNYIENIAINCQNLPAGSTVIVCGRKVVE